MFHYTVETNTSIEETVNKLEANLKEEQFSFLWQLDFRDKFAEKGIEFSDSFIVFEVCNPHEAKKVLDENILAGYFLPCKIIVYRHEGKTKIGMPKPTALMATVDNEQLMSLAKDIEKRLIACIDKSI